MLFEIVCGSTVTVLVCFLANRLYFKGGVCRSKKRLNGKTAIITGSNTGIGYETALDFAFRGARVIMACRDINKAKKAANEIIRLSNNKNVDVEYLDLADLNSVRSFAKKINEKVDKLDLLINNAGVMQCPYWKSVQGFEMQLAVNHLGHFLLTNLLLDLLKKSEDARIINVSSFAHRAGKINWNDLNSKLNYSSINAYYQSKVANILFTKELANRLKEKTIQDTNISTVALNPGLVRTEILRHSNIKADIALAYITVIFFPIYWTVSKTQNEGAQTTIFCALDDTIPNHNGGYFSDCKLAKVSSRANNAEDAKKLWDLSVEMVEL